MGRETEDIQGVQRHSPNIPNRDKSTHSRGAGGRPYVRKRHPEFHGTKGDYRKETDNLNYDDPGPPGDTPPEEENDLNLCPPWGDLSCYVIDHFDREVSPQTYTSGASWSTPTVYFANVWTAPGHEGLGNYSQDDQVQPFTTYLQADYTRKNNVISSTVGTHSHPWTYRPTEDTAGYGCGGVSFQFDGWRESNVMIKATVPSVPASMAGVTLSGNDANMVEYLSPTGLRGGTVGQAGCLVNVVTGTDPTSIRDGVTVAHLQAGVAQDIFIPGELIPEEGDVFWIVFAPAWECVKGYPQEIVCDFVWPWMNGANNSGEGTIGPQSPGTQYTLQWETWTSNADDYGPVRIDTSYPVNVQHWMGGTKYWIPADAAGATTGITNDSFYLTAVAGSPKTMTLSLDNVYDGLGEEDTTDNDAFWSGNPWDVAMRARFKLTTAGDVTEAGNRYLRIEWHDGYSRYFGEARLGDPNYAQGVRIGDDDRSAFTAKDITEGSWMWLAVDARNPLEMRGKIWKEEGVMGGNEPITWDVVLARESDADNPTEGDYFKLELSAGNDTGANQTIEVDRIEICTGAEDCQWVEDILGASDGEQLTFKTKYPWRPFTLNVYFDGHRIPVVAENREQSTFTVRSGMVPDERMFVTAVYLVDMTGDDDDEEYT